MKIEGEMSTWGDAIHFGPYVDWQDWNIWHRVFSIGFSFGPWDFGLKISLWDVEEAIEMLVARGMTREEAWGFCDAVRKELPDPYSGRVNIKREIERALES